MVCLATSGECFDVAGTEMDAFLGKKSRKNSGKFILRKSTYGQNLSLCPVGSQNKVKSASPGTCQGIEGAVMGAF